MYVEVIKRPQYVVAGQPEKGVQSMPPPLSIVEGCKYDFSVVAAMAGTEVCLSCANLSAAGLVRPVGLVPQPLHGERSLELRRGHHWPFVPAVVRYCWQSRSCWATTRRYACCCVTNWTRKIWRSSARETAFVRRWSKGCRRPVAASPDRPPLCLVPGPGRPGPLQRVPLVAHASERGDRRALGPRIAGSSWATPVAPMRPCSSVLADGSFTPVAICMPAASSSRPNRTIRSWRRDFVLPAVV